MTNEIAQSKWLVALLSRFSGMEIFLLFWGLFIVAFVYLLIARKQRRERRQFKD